MHIARKLAAAKSLRTVHLNLDFRDDHGPYCHDNMFRGPWYATFSMMYGPEILAVLQSCPLLEYVGLLYHDKTRSVWAEFHPPRCAVPYVRPKHGPGYVIPLSCSILSDSRSETQRFRISLYGATIAPLDFRVLPPVLPGNSSFR